MEITIAICTHPHGASLVTTLRSLAEDLEPSHLDTPVLVIRSETEEGTPIPALLARGVETLPLRLRFIDEPQRGIAAARARALAESTSDVVLFVDDDVYVRRGWFSLMSSAMMPGDVGAAGGVVIPKWPDGRPWWLTQRLNTYFGERRAGPTATHLPFGLNMAIRRPIAEAVGGFRYELGHWGRVPGLHEETDLMFRIAQAGYKIAEVEGAVVDHLIRREQVKVRWILRRAWHEGRSDAVRDRSHEAVPLTVRWVKLASLLMVLLPSLLAPRVGLYVVVRILVNVSYFVTHYRGPLASA